MLGLTGAADSTHVSAAVAALNAAASSAPSNPRRALLSAVV
jgi:hypothetical protein